MLRFLPSLRNAVYIPAEHFVLNSVGFFPDKCRNLQWHVMFCFVQIVGICFVHFVI